MTRRGATPSAGSLSSRAPPHSARAVVVAVRHTSHGVRCDVLFYGMRNPFRRDVPVMQWGGGVGNDAVWVPNPTTVDLDTMLPFTIDAVRRLDALDGDHVLVTFVGGSLADALIVGALPHPKRAYKVESNVRRLSHQGAVVEIDASGNVLVDTSAAPKDNAGRPLVAGGAVTVNAGAHTVTVIGGEVKLGTAEANRGVARLDDDVEVVLTAAAAGRLMAPPGGGPLTITPDPENPDATGITLAGRVAVGSDIVKAD